MEESRTSIGVSWQCANAIVVGQLGMRIWEAHVCRCLFWLLKRDDLPFMHLLRALSVWYAEQLKGTLSASICSECIPIAYAQDSAIWLEKTKIDKRPLNSKHHVLSAHRWQHQKQAPKHVWRTEHDWTISHAHTIPVQHLTHEYFEYYIYYIRSQIFVAH